MSEKATERNMIDNPKVIFKQQITHLLLLLLNTSGHDVDDSPDFEEAYRKRMKFQKRTDWKRFKASIDLLDDTEYAIMSAFKYQLGDLSIDNADIGETNIRLYGIVNAVYLQMNAFIQIANLLNYPNPKEIEEKFQQLNIYKLRGIVGSHTVDYMYDKETLQSIPKITKTTSFRIIQFYLEKTGSEIVVLDENDITFEFNLLKVLIEYEKNATDLLIKLIIHAINKLIHKKEYKIEMKKRLDTMLLNLIDYSQIDKNKEYKINQIKEITASLRNL